MTKSYECDIVILVPITTLNSLCEGLIGLVVKGMTALKVSTERWGFKSLIVLKPIFLSPTHLHQPALQEASSKIMCLSGRGGWLLL